MVEVFRGRVVVVSEIYEVHEERLSPGLKTRLTLAVCPRKEDVMLTILIVVMVLMLLGALPAWPHSRQWGYYPSSGLGLVVLILVILMLSGRL